jgi:hypothetical protein
MSISTQTLQTLNGMFKVQYADKMKDLIPDMSVVISKIPFVPNNQKSGSVFIQPVILSMDQGFTCHGSNDQILTMNNPVGHTIGQAQVQSCVYSGRSFVSNAVLQRASGSEQSFVDATSHIVQALSKSFSHMLEGMHWYGGVGLATSTAATALLNNKQLGISAANSAAFLWIGAEGMPIDIVDSTGTIVLSTEVSSINIGTSDGSNQDGGILLTLASVSGLVNASAYTIYRKGYVGLEHKGIKYILTNDNVFGINGANYSLWKSNRYAANAPLTYSLVSQAVARAIGRGLTGPLMAVVSPKVLRSLFPDYFAIGNEATSSSTDTRQSNSKARRFNNESDVKNLFHGTDSVKLSVDGVAIEFISSEFVKGGDAFFLDRESWMRVGSTGPTFNLQGAPDQYFLQRPDSLACEIRMLSDESPFSDSLNKNLIITGVTGQ